MLLGCWGHEEKGWEPPHPLQTWVCRHRRKVHRLLFHNRHTSPDIVWRFPNFAGGSALGFMEMTAFSMAQSLFPTPGSGSPCWAPSLDEWVVAKHSSHWVAAARMQSRTGPKPGRRNAGWHERWQIGKSSARGSVQGAEGPGRSHGSGILLLWLRWITLFLLSTDHAMLDLCDMLCVTRAGTWTQIGTI